MYSAVRYLFFAGFTCLILVASLISANALRIMPHAFIGMDKAAHFLVYACYTLITWHALLRHWTREQRAIWGAVVYSSLFGVLMEISQTLARSSGRTFSSGDMLANALGALLTGVLVWAMAGGARRKAEGETREFGDDAASFPKS